MQNILDERRAWTWLLGAVLLVELFWLSFSPVRDPDTWWHLKTGELIWRTWSIPRVDPYSYVIGGKPWIAFEWLFEVLLYGAYSIAGAASILGLKALVLACAFLLFFRFAGSTAWAALALALVAVIDIEFLTERPQIFDYLLLGVLVNLIGRREKDPGPLKWQFPLLQMLWTNLHGGAAIIGLLVVAARTVTARRDQVRNWVWLFPAGLAAMLLNPHGYRIFTHLYATLAFPNKAMFFDWALIPEWAPLWSQPMTPTRLLLFAAGVVSLPFAWKQDRWLSLLCIGFGAMAIISMRHLSLFSFAVALTAARALNRAWPVRPGWKSTLAGTAVIGLLCAGVAYRHSYFRALGHVGFQEPPERAIRFLDDNNVEGRMFHSYGLGGYLIWKTYPRRKVFVDGRNVEYGPEFIRKAAFWFLPQVWDELDRTWDFDYAIVENDSHYNAMALDASPRWALVFWDDAALVYLKREPKNEALIRRFGYRWLKPNQLDYGYLGKPLKDNISSPKVLAEIERSIRESDKNANAYQLRAMALLQLGRFDEAVRDLEWVAAKLPDNPGPWMSLGWCYENMRDYAKARIAYENARRAAHRADDFRSEAFLYNNLGTVEFKLGHREEAEKMFRQCLNLWPSHPQARQNLVRIGAIP